MSNNFTPGPWQHRAFPTQQGVVFDISTTEPGCVDVAFTYSHEANARLIASAPCLLKALQNLMTWQVKNVHVWENSAFDHAAEIVAKATGGTT